VLTVIGLTSGISMDGVDAVILDIEGSGEDLKYSVRAEETFPFSNRLRQRLRDVCNVEGGKAVEIPRLNYTLGELLSLSAVRVASRARIGIRSVDLIGSHGQTIFHLPTKIRENGRRAIISTLQIGEPAVIAERTGKTTVADFRSADIAAYGCGSPLLSYVDYILFMKYQRPMVLLNIGGIATITAIDGTNEIESISAFEVGPGNIVIDNVMRILSNNGHEMDYNGLFALRGAVNQQLLDELLESDYFKQQPPKSVGSMDFGTSFCDELCNKARDRNISNDDLVATVSQLTVASITEAVKDYILPAYDAGEIVVSGGGVHNRFIMQGLSESFPEMKVVNSKEYGISPDFKEALGFAILAVESIHERSTSFPWITGAAHEVTLGKIIPGRNWQYINLYARDYREHGEEKGRVEE